MINYVRHPVIMKVHKINRYGVGAGLAGKVLAIHLNLVSRQSRPQRTYYRFNNLIFIINRLTIL
jgi:hypothetical protein